MTEYTDIKFIKRGMFLGENIYFENSLIYPCGTFLTNTIIYDLKKKNFKELLIENIDKDFDLSLSETIKSLEAYIINNKNYDKIDEIHILCEEIIFKMFKTKGFIEFLSEIKSKDLYTYIHCLNVGLISLAIGINYNNNIDFLVNLGISAFLHDYGKILVPSKVLNKPGLLNDTEYEIMKTHVLLGYTDLEKNSNYSSDILTGILDHHERFNGSGYLNKKEGYDISLYGRIIAIADCFEAMSNNRIYREGHSLLFTYKCIINNKNEIFDPKLIDIFKNNISIYQLGKIITLTNNRNCLVVKNYKDNLTRPKLKDIETNEIVNLNKNNKYKEIFIIT